MVHSEALLVGSFPDENIKSPGEIEVEPMSDQCERAKRRYNIPEDMLSSLCRRLALSTGRWRDAFHLVVALRVVP